ALDVFRGTEPQIGGPHLNAEFAAQKDRRHRPPATEVEYTHPGLQRQRRGEPLGDPERIRATAGAGNEPFGVVAGSSRKLSGNQALVGGHNCPFPRLSTGTRGAEVGIVVSLEGKPTRFARRRGKGLHICRGTNRTQGSHDASTEDFLTRASRAGLFIAGGT